MPKQEFAIEPGGAKRLAVEWKGQWKNLTVSFDGLQVGQLENQQELREGRSFVLPDNSSVSVKLKTGMATELQVLRDGKPLPGSASDPGQRVKSAAGVLWLIAGLNLLIGVLAAVLQIPLLQNLGFGIGSLIFGVIFAGLAFATGKRIGPALIAAIILFGLDAVLSLVVALGAGGSPPIGGFIARAFLFIPLIQAVPAMRQLREQRETA